MPISSTKQVGSDRARLVLLRLVEYAAGDGLAYPSAQTLADGIAGLTRRDVRNAFDALEGQGLIERVPSQRKSVTWRVVVAGDLAGDLAGHVAGDLAGMPATNGSEANRSSAPIGAAAPTRGDDELAHIRTGVGGYLTPEEEQHVDVLLARGRHPEMIVNTVTARRAKVWSR